MTERLSDHQAHELAEALHYKVQRGQAISAMWDRNEITRYTRDVIAQVIIDTLIVTDGFEKPLDPRSWIASLTVDQRIAALDPRKRETVADGDRR